MAPDRVAPRVALYGTGFVGKAVTRLLDGRGWPIVREIQAGASVGTQVLAHSRRGPV